MPTIIRDLEFEDTDQLSRGIGWDLDFRQLDAGSFTGNADLFLTPAVTVMRISLDRSFHQRGRPLTGTRTYGLVDPGTPDVRWHGIAARGGLLDFNSPMGFDGFSAQTLNGYTFSIDQELLTRTAGAIGVEAPDDGAGSTRVWHGVAAGEVARLRRLLQGSSAIYGDTDDSRADREFEQLLAEQLLMLMQLAPEQPTPEQWRRYRQVLDRAIVFAEENIEESFTATDICAGIGVSYSTLQRVFRREFGTTPMKYVRTLRLQRVRNALLTRDSGDTVADIANRWGFWHLGQFARDYRLHFHELPRETLRSHTSHHRG